MDAAALPPERSFSAARSGQRTLTRCRLRPTRAPPRKPLPLPLRAAPRAGLSPQVPRWGGREPRAGGRPQVAPRGAPWTVPGGGGGGSAERPHPPGLTFLRLLFPRVGVGGGGGGGEARAAPGPAGTEDAQVPGRRTGARSPPAGGPREPGSAKTPPRSPLPLLIGQRGPKAPAGPGPVSQL